MAVRGRSGMRFCLGMDGCYDARVPQLEGGRQELGWKPERANTWTQH